MSPELGRGGQRRTYRVEYWSAGRWTVDDDTITGTSHTVDGLACGSAHWFRVSAYGSGTVYAAAWSEPSAALTESASACVPPTFGADSYAFSVNGDAAAGVVVGSVTATGSATDDGGEPVTCAIASGDEAGLFAPSVRTRGDHGGGDLKSSGGHVVDADSGGGGRERRYGGRVGGGGRSRRHATAGRPCPTPPTTPSRSEMNAMRPPPGDQLGYQSFLGLSVRRVWPERAGDEEATHFSAPRSAALAGRRLRAWPRLRAGARARGRRGRGRGWLPKCRPR